MKRHIALLRGINVGKAKRVPMASVRALLEGLGHREVRTLLNSGNAVFDAAGGAAPVHARRIRAALLEHTGVDCEVVVKTAGELAAALAEEPAGLRGLDDSRLHALFVQDPAVLAELVDLAQQDWTPEALFVGRHAAWLWCADGMADSRLAKAVGRILKERGTARNRATLVKLQALADARISRAAGVASAPG